MNKVTQIIFGIFCFLVLLLLINNTFFSSKETTKVTDYEQSSEVAKTPTTYEPKKLSFKPDLSGEQLDVYNQITNGIEIDHLQGSRIADLIKQDYIIVKDNFDAYWLEGYRHFRLDLNKLDSLSRVLEISEIIKQK